MAGAQTDDYTRSAAGLQALAVFEHPKFDSARGSGSAGRDEPLAKPAPAGSRPGCAISVLEIPKPGSERGRRSLTQGRWRRIRRKPSMGNMPSATPAREA